MTTLSARTVVCLLGFAIPAFPAAAFDPPSDTSGPLTVGIEGPSEVTQPGAPVLAGIVLTNSGSSPLSGAVAVRCIDDWQVQPSGKVAFSVEAGGTSRLDFQVTPGPGTYNAHYPIHAFVEFEADGKASTAHAVQIVEARPAVPPRALRKVNWQPLPVRLGAEMPLWRVPVFRVVLVPPDAREGHALPAGWQGADPASRTSVIFGRDVDRRGTREAVAIHPPWGGPEFQSTIIEFPVKLPDTQPVTLRFANAIRDHVPDREPPSDGVTFRVRVTPFDAPDGHIGEIVFENHTDAKVWQDAEADLGRWAGQAVRLQLESHPGPKNDPTCDESFWAEPTLVAGPSAATPLSNPSPTRDLGKLRRDDVAYTVKVTPGARGLLDATVAFQPEGGGESLSFAGFPLRVLGDDLSDTRSLASLISIREEGAPSQGHYHVRHSFETWAGAFDVIVELWLGREALQARFRLENAPEPQPWQAVYIEDVSAGAWNRRAGRVYAGVGNVIEEPQAFQLGFDGHRLATSFVGFEFKDGPGLVQAVDVPPSSLDVNPEKGRYTLHAAHNATLTFIPANNVWEAARAWHDVNGLEAGPGVRGLAGRFVFDLWGGRYGESADALEKAFSYGLVDSLVVWHNWQRWGYDYRLPDIYPPNPQFGTQEEFLRLVDVCRRNGVLFAPHDNYIDFYPDAQGFSYSKTAFSSNGQPWRGWLNEGRGAQAYWWRPDLLDPPIRRNLQLIRNGFAPTAYFIDVWSSAAPHDYWTQDGRFFDRVFTRNAWGRHFAWIRGFLGNNAPQISESGHDQLIGFLDGAQANHLRVWRPGEPTSGWMDWKIDCRDAERVPWLDAAHHDRFVLHGAGYESRYLSGLDPRTHGIYSDDYICTEVLTGHPAMVPEPFSRDVVRKYWLLHDLMRGIALQRMDRVEFVENIHRQHVRWDDAETWVNRGTDDWTVEGHVLPPFGFYARGPIGGPVYEAAIERRDGTIGEWASSPAGIYANARPVNRHGLAVTAPEARDLGNRTLDLTLEWNTEAPLSQPYRVFVHFVDEAGKIRFQADYDPPQPTTAWQGARRDSVQARVPDDAPAGQPYELRVGLYHPATHARAEIDGWADDNRAIRLGTVRREGTAVTWSPMGPDPRLARMNPEGKPIDFGPVLTNGACRLSNDGEGLRITPLPDSRPFRVQIRWSALPWELPPPTTVKKIDAAGRVLEQAPITLKEGIAEIECAPEVFAYRLEK